MSNYLYKILITGATGFLGSSLLKELALSNNFLVALKRSSSHLNRVKVNSDKIIFYDVDNTKLADIFLKEKPDIVIHTACKYDKGNVSMKDIIETNLIFGLDVFEEARKNDTELFINIDTALPNNINKYSLSKSQFTEWIKFDNKNINVVNCRIDYIYGSENNQNTFLNRLYKEMISETQGKIALTKGTQKRDFIYIDDVVNAINLIITKQKNIKGYSEFDICTGKLIMVKEFIETMASIIEKQKKINVRERLNFGAIPYRKNEVEKPLLDNSKIKSIGWKPKINYKKGILKFTEV